MANFPEIPKDLLASKDKKVLREFMKFHYDRKLDGRLGWDEALKQSRETIRIKKKMVRKEIARNLSDNAPANPRYKEYLNERAEEALRVNRKVHHMYEEDTSRWLWDTSKVEWVKQGFAPGTCVIRILANGRELAVDRETVGIFLDTRS